MSLLGLTVTVIVAHVVIALVSLSIMVAYSRVKVSLALRSLKAEL